MSVAKNIRHFSCLNTIIKSIHTHYFTSSSYNMPYKRLSQQDLFTISGMSKAGMNPTAIGRAMGFARTTVASALKRLEADPQSTPHPVRGRPRKWTLRDVRVLKRLVRQNRRTSWRQMALFHARRIGLSARTLRRILAKFDYKKHLAVRKPALTAKHVRARLQFARAHRDWTPEDWARVVWSDETAVTQSDSQVRRWVFRLPTEKLHKDCVQGTRKGPSIKVMAWGCFYGRTKGPLVRMEGGLIMGRMYADLLSTVLLPFMEEHSDALPLAKPLIFMHDNAPVHTARVAKAVLADDGVEVMEWPAQSPDLNPIENIWHTLKYRFHQRNPDMMLEKGGVAVVQEKIWAALEEVWAGFTEEDFEKVWKSMPGRMEAVIKAKGLWTKY